MSILCLDVTLPAPAENLACDEALLEERAGQETASVGVLRFWESDRHFVVVGFANKVAEEVQIEACRAAGVPVLRRCSGGGTVLQGPGCLNYALVLPIDEDGPLASITGANRLVMERHREVLADLLGGSVTVEGHTDLAWEGRKFSGNAQRRKRDWLLFHGTFLLGLDFGLLGRVLRLPSRQPEYRAGRSHRDFLTAIAISRAQLKSALARAWDAEPPASVNHAIPAGPIAKLVAKKYGNADWNFCR